MDHTGTQVMGFEIGIALSDSDASLETVQFLVGEMKKTGLQIETFQGLSTQLFIKVAAPLKTLARAATELQIIKPTQLGMDLPFDWEEAHAFVKHPDGSLFSWCDRYRCYQHLIFGIVNHSNSPIVISKLPGNRGYWEVGESLVRKLESIGIVEQVFPLHDEYMRKQLLKNWALNWGDFTQQPIDDIHSYLGTQIATYFAFLGMFTRWMAFPATFGLALHLFSFGPVKSLLLPVFFVSITLWAILFCQFWKRKHSAHLARWQVECFALSDPAHNTPGIQDVSLPSDVERTSKGKEDIQRTEWFKFLMRFRNDAMMIFSIICLQLPFELAYAHLYEVAGSGITRFGLSAVYLLAIQYFTRIGGKISVGLIKHESNENREYQANSLVYKVFGLYFMQTYIGLLYHALLHRNFDTLREMLLERLIITEVIQNFVESSFPYLKYIYNMHKAFRDSKRSNELSEGKVKFATKTENEYLKPTYAASIGEEFEDGLFDDYLELALRFGLVTMFACAFPLVFAFASLINLMEIRMDAFKLLTMFKRPVPRVASTNGAWLNIFQFLIVTSICTNCAILVCLYDKERKWKVEPGLAAILVMEHVLLLVKFGFSRFIPEEPAWVRASRMKNVAQAQDTCSKQLLGSVSGERGEVHEMHKTE
uniref:Anoctamin transmembrane domain-containing protein n=1 Tax=Kalanchoe fedtschenkoi TaxID=63787 RepID=A0A7N1A5W1_KALFE